MYNHIDTGIIDDVPIIIGNKIYCVDTNNENGYGLYKIINFSKECLEITWRKEIDDFTTKNGLTNEDRFYLEKINRIEDRFTREDGSVSQRGSSGKALSNTEGESINNENGILKENDLKFSVENTSEEEIDSLGNKISNETSKYFENSLARDDNGNLLVLYHGTSSGGFSIFDKELNSDSYKRDSYYGKNVIFLTNNSDVANLFGNKDKTIDTKAINKYEKDIAKLNKNIEKLKTLENDDFMNFYNEISDSYLELIGKTFDGKNIESKIVKDGDKYVWIYAIGDTIENVYNKEKADTKYYKTYSGNKIKEIILNNIEMNKEDATLKGQYKVYANITNPLVVIADSDDNHWHGFKPSFISDIQLNDEVQNSKDKKITTDGIIYWMIKNNKYSAYDGVIIKGVVEGGNGIPSDVYVAFNSN